MGLTARAIWLPACSPTVWIDVNFSDFNSDLNVNSKIKEILEKMDFFKRIGDNYNDSKNSIASFVLPCSLKVIAKLL